MNAIIIFSSLAWIMVMSAIIVINPVHMVKVTASIIIALNISTIFFNFFTGNKKNSLEAKIYSDNLSVLLLIITFPLDFFYGYPLHIMLSIIICYIYLKNRNRVYNVLMFLSTLQVILYVCLCSKAFCPQIVYNTSSMVMLIVLLYFIKNKLILDPESKYKDKVTKINDLIRYEVINCITAMNYHIRELDDDNKLQMQQLIQKLNLITQIDKNNFKSFIEILKDSLITKKMKKVGINYIDNSTKNFSFNIYAMYLILYTILESSIINSSTEVCIKLSDTKIEVIDNGSGYDIKSKLFCESSLKTALDLLKLFDMPVIFSSIVGSGTIISFSIE